MFGTLIAAYCQFFRSFVKPSVVLVTVVTGVDGVTGLDSDKPINKKKSTKKKWFP